MNILLVDDDIDCLEALRRLVCMLGHSCAIADDPRDAMAQYAQHAFDLVITDFRMPAMDGSELARKIRVVNPEAKIILLTGYATFGEMPGESLFLAVIEKPVDVHELKDVLDKM